jgi:hypothetical protein
MRRPEVIKGMLASPDARKQIASMMIKQVCVCVGGGLCLLLLPLTCRGGGAAHRAPPRGPS